ncbi:hypothetical protein [Streptomyces sp. NPDC127084]|uniref:hypothetical protein n=1 Tax=Streptomyces sp. NPDC127084 TaxID=3347133 RepID=UPI00364FB99B
MARTAPAGPRVLHGPPNPGGHLERGGAVHRDPPLYLTASWAGRLLDAQAGRSTESPNEVLAQAAKELYFQERGARAQQLEEVELTGIDYIDAKY